MSSSTSTKVDSGKGGDGWDNSGDWGDFGNDDQTSSTTTTTTQKKKETKKDSWGEFEDWLAEEKTAPKKD